MIQFWHKVRLKDGTYTNGKKDVEAVLDKHLFNDLNFDGQSVLDLGCWDGAFSFLAEQRGAARVVSFDRPSRHWGGREGYDFLHQHFASKAVYVDGDIYDLEQHFQKQEFDVVLAYGILYHLSDPLLAIRNMFYVCKKTIAFEGLCSPIEQPVLELRRRSDASVVYSPSLSYMNTVAEFEGFVLRKSFKTDGRHALIYDRERPASFNYPDKIYPPRSQT